MFDIKRVFISGPMTGIEDYNRPAFMEAEEKLKKAGFSVFNPAWLRFDSGFGDDAIMAIDLMALSHCNYIYQLEGWEKSKGASAEWMAALSMGIKAVNDSWLDWFVDAFVENRKKWQQAAAQMNEERLEKVKKELKEVNTLNLDSTPDLVIRGKTLATETALRIAEEENKRYSAEYMSKIAAMQTALYEKGGLAVNEKEFKKGEYKSARQEN